MRRLAPRVLHAPIAGIVAWVILRAGALFAALSDDGQARLLRGLRRLLPRGPAGDGIGELIDAVRAGPPNTALLRRLLRESKQEEIRQLVLDAFFAREMDAEDV